METVSFIYPEKNGTKGMAKVQIYVTEYFN